MQLKDPSFGTIIDYDALRAQMKPIYDQLYPEFRLLGAMTVGEGVVDETPGHMVAVGASMLAYMMLVAAKEDELAATLKDKIFTLGWTEEHCGSDLLSVRTQAAPMSDDPDERIYHVKGKKWLINNSYHADYHLILGKIDPTQNGPRSMSLFLVPHSSTCNWKRIETQVLNNMVLTEYEIDGPGQLVGKRGQGLSIVQQMAMPSKYQCTYVGIRMLDEAIPATIEHLASKQIFGSHPVQFTNVFRQLYNLSIQAALMHFMCYRGMALSDSSFLQFHGTILKSFVLLRVNEILSQNLLVAGSKGFLRESPIGRNAFDSFVMPVFDGHYTINTLMGTKHSRRYLTATRRIDAQERIETLRATLYQALPGQQISANPLDIRHPDFFDYADYLQQLDPPIPLDGAEIVQAALALLDEIEERGLSNDADHRYKSGVLLHWIESILAACELWKVTENEHYVNAIVQQYNGMVGVYNGIVSEGGFDVPFLLPMHQLPLEETDDPRGFLLGLLDVRGQIQKPVQLSAS